MAWQPVANMVVGGAREADPAGFGQRLESRRHVHAVPEDIALLGDDVAHMEADAELESPPAGNVAVAVAHAALDPDDALDGLDRAREFEEEAVAHALDHAPAMGAHGGLDDATVDLADKGERSRVVLGHVPAVADEVEGDDGGEPPLHSKLLHWTVPTLKGLDLWEPQGGEVAGRPRKAA